MLKKIAYRILLTVLSFGVCVAIAQLPRWMRGSTSKKKNKISTEVSAGDSFDGEGIVIDGQRMVKINGRYFKYRDDGVYQTRDEGAIFHSDESAARRLAEAAAKSQDSGFSLLKSFLGSEVLELGDLETLRDAQEQIEERNKFLEEIVEVKQ